MLRKIAVSNFPPKRKNSKKIAGKKQNNKERATKLDFKDEGQLSLPTSWCQFLQHLTRAFFVPKNLRSFFYLQKFL